MVCIEDWLKENHPAIWNEYLLKQMIELQPRALEMAKKILGEIPKEFNPKVKQRRVSKEMSEPEYTQMLMGHQDISTTMVYTHISPDKPLEMYEKVF